MYIKYVVYVPFSHMRVSWYIEGRCFPSVFIAIGWLVQYPPVLFSLKIWTYQVLVEACGISSLGSPGIEPRSPALRAWSLSHWTTREVPIQCFVNDQLWREYMSLEFQASALLFIKMCHLLHCYNGKCRKKPRISLCSLLQLNCCILYVIVSYQRFRWEEIEFLTTYKINIKL